MNEKEFYFTLLNGEAPEYDAENPYVQIESPDEFTELIKDSEALEWFDKLGLTEFFKVLFNIVMNLVGKYFLAFIK